MDAREFIAQRPHLVWSTKSYGQLSDEAIVEATLNYGNWEDVRELTKILGMERTAEIFRRRSQPDKLGRQNYSRRTRHFFNLYFNKHAPGSSE